LANVRFEREGTVRIDQRFLGWGVFFIVLGSVPLAVRGGLLTTDAAGTSWRLWPLFLVGSGIGLLLRDRRAAIVGGLIVSITFGLIGGGLLAGGWGDLGAIACGNDPASGPQAQQSGALDAVARVTLDHRCGDLNVRLTDAGGWTLASSGGDAAPDVSTSSSDLRIRSGGHRVFVFPGIGGPREIWNVGLPMASTIDLATTLNAGDGRLDLRGGHFGTIATTVNAGDMRIVLPASSLTGDLTVNAGSIRLCAPAGVGLRFTTNDSNITSSFHFDGAGLVKSGSTWTSADFVSATVTIDLSTTANAGSVVLNPAEGCR
jgi:hypothetical protein